MKVGVFGTGYVGLVTGACLADIGHVVLCADVDEEKIARLGNGEVPFFEPGLEAVLERNLEAGRLFFTGDPAAAVAHADIIVVAVGTPLAETGEVDLSHLLSVVDSIGEYMDRHKVVAIKSTVPVGTCDRVAERLSTALARRGARISFDVVANPEFLKEGTAVADFQKPDRIVVGAASERARAAMAELYESFDGGRDRILNMDVRSAELTKYAANAMLATRISFINEIANFAERLGADIEQVRRGIGADPRIGDRFINAGIGYGGSCLPKDMSALARMAADIGYEAHVIKAVASVNDRQKRRPFDRLVEHFGGEAGLEGKTVAIWGLSFKPGTDDMREAPSRALIEALWGSGANVRAFDPAAIGQATHIYGDRGGLVLAADMYSALDGADALAICAEWQQFRTPDFSEMARRMNARVIFDGRNLYEPDRLRGEGWVYYSIGRPPALPDGRFR